LGILLVKTEEIPRAPPWRLRGQGRNGEISNNAHALARKLIQRVNTMPTPHDRLIVHAIIKHKPKSHIGATLYVTMVTVTTTFESGVRDCHHHFFLILWARES